MVNASWSPLHLPPGHPSPESLLSHAFHRDLGEATAFPLSLTSFWLSMLQFPTVQMPSSPTRPLTAPEAGGRRPFSRRGCMPLISTHTCPAARWCSSALPPVHLADSHLSLRLGASGLLPVEPGEHRPPTSPLQGRPEPWSSPQWPAVKAPQFVEGGNALCRKAAPYVQRRNSATGFQEGCAEAVLEGWWKSRSGGRRPRRRKEGLRGEGCKKGESQELWAVLQDRRPREGEDHDPVLAQWGAMEGSGESWGQSACWR